MKTLAPDYTFENVLAIDTKLFQGKDLLIFDIDNTLFYPESTAIKPEILQWFKDVQKQYTCLCFSNSPTIQKRKETIRSLLGCEIFMSSYKKPSKKLFQQIVQQYHANPKHVVVIGDMRMTDIFFGKRNHALTILVKPMSRKERFSLRVMRTLEDFLFR